MDKFDFTPNYDKWWNKEDLTKEELPSLMFGINPDQLQRYEEIRKKQTLGVLFGGIISGRKIGDFQKYQETIDKHKETAEETHYREAFENHFTEMYGPYFLREAHEIRAELLKKGYWGTGKKKFIWNLYVNGLKTLEGCVCSGFLHYLKSIGEWPKDFDHFSDHGQYLLDQIKWENIDISEEDVGICVLLNLEPEWFLRFVALSSTADEHNMEKLFFKREYRSFFKSKCFGPEEYWRIKRKKLWSGEFSKFAQALHEHGHIFPGSTYCFLNKRGIELDYPEDNPLRRRLVQAVNKKLWSLEEAVHHFLGQNPQNGKELFIDLSGYSFLTILPDGITAHGGDIDVKESVKNRTLIGDIKSYSEDGEDKYIPKDIIECLIDITGGQQPPPLLAEILGLKNLNMMLASETFTKAVNQVSKDKPLNRLQKINLLKETSVPLIYSFIEQNKRRPQHLEISEMLVAAKIVPEWGESTITRYMSYSEFLANYEKKKKSIKSKVVS